jgi:hypothetical protein
MNARKKMNVMYLGRTAAFAAFVGLVFASWWAFAVTFALTAGGQIMAGNSRLAGGYR